MPLSQWPLVIYLAPGISGFKFNAIASNLKKALVRKNIYNLVDDLEFLAILKQLLKLVILFLEGINLQKSIFDVFNYHTPLGLKRLF